MKQSERIERLEEQLKRQNDININFLELADKSLHDMINLNNRINISFWFNIYNFILIVISVIVIYLRS